MSLRPNTSIALGGYQYVGEAHGTGTATSTTISGGGGQLVGDLSGTGTATDTAISGGYQVLGSGGSGICRATSTTIGYGSQIVGESGGTGFATATTINNGGLQQVGYYYGTGTATGTAIDSGGEQIVYGSAGTATSTTIFSGGLQLIEGVATNSVVYGGGTVEVIGPAVVDNLIIDGGTVKFINASGVKGAGPISFAPTTNYGLLDLTIFKTFTSSFAFAVSGFAGSGGSAGTSDIIQVAGSGAGDHVVWTLSGASGTLQIEDASNNVLETLTLDGSLYQQRFVLSQSAGVDQIAYDSSAPCFCRGTSIATDRGDVAVENLHIGDLVVTASGALRPIIWIGRRDIEIAGRRWAQKILPVRVREHAFGEASPRRDL